MTAGRPQQALWGVCSLHQGLTILLFDNLIITVKRSILKKIWDYKMNYQK